MQRGRSKQQKKTLKGYFQDYKISHKNINYSQYKPQTLPSDNFSKELENETNFRKSLLSIKNQREHLQKKYDTKVKSVIVQTTDELFHCLIISKLQFQPPDLSKRFLLLTCSDVTCSKKQPNKKRRTRIIEESSDELDLLSSLKEDTLSKEYRRIMNKRQSLKRPKKRPRLMTESQKSQESKGKGCQTIKDKLLLNEKNKRRLKMFDKVIEAQKAKEQKEEPHKKFEKVFNIKKGLNTNVDMNSYNYNPTKPKCQPSKIVKQYIEGNSKIENHKLKDDFTYSGKNSIQNGKLSGKKAQTKYDFINISIKHKKDGQNPEIKNGKSEEEVVKKTTQLLEEGVNSNEETKSNPFEDKVKREENVNFIDSQSLNEGSSNLKHAKKKQLKTTNKDEADALKDSMTDGGRVSKKKRLHWGYEINKMQKTERLIELQYQQGRVLTEEITKEHFLRLDPQIYLNDMLVNFYLRFLEFYVIDQNKRQEVCFYSTWFMQKLCNLGVNDTVPTFSFSNQSSFKIDYGGVRRWTRTKNLDIFQKKYVFFPVCQNEHWSMAVLCHPKRAAEYIQEHIKGCQEGTIPKLKASKLQQKIQNSMQNEQTVKSLAEELNENLNEPKDKENEEQQEQLESKNKRVKKVSSRKEKKQLSSSLGNSDSDNEDHCYDEEDYEDEDQSQQDYEDDDDDDGYDMPWEGQNHYFNNVYYQMRQQQEEKVSDSKPYILYFDSMSTFYSNQNLISGIRQYTEQEYLDKKIQSQSPALVDYFTNRKYEWDGFSQDSMPCYQASLPKQKNSFDCGLFLLEYAECFLDNSDFIEQDLLQKNGKLFSRRLIDAKREIFKRIVCALYKQPTSTNEVATRYLKWREKYKGKLLFVTKNNQ